MTATTESTAALPVGYDDKKSRWYIAPELRAHYQLMPEIVRRNRFKGGSLEYPNEVTADAAHYGEHVVKVSGELARLRTEYRNAPAVDLETAVQRRVVQIAKTMTREDEEWWLHHAVSLNAARSRHAQAQAREAARPLREAQQICDVCGQHNERVFFNQNLPARICPPCNTWMPLAQANSRPTADGRPRLDVVAEWLRKNA